MSFKRLHLAFVSVSASVFLVAACSSSSGPSTPATPPWLENASIFVKGVGNQNQDCRPDICPHNENTDLTSFGGALYLVHRTAISQVLGDNSSLHIYRSTDSGKTFTQTAYILAPSGPATDAGPPPDGGLFVGGGRDLRDPHFYTVGNTLYIEAITRLPVLTSRDSCTESISVETHTTDGTNWSPLNPITQMGFSFWRVKEENGVYYDAAYTDGDTKVTLFSSPDGANWTQGADIYTVTADTPLETELTFMPSGRMLALVRTDGDSTNEAVYQGDDPTVNKTKVCWAMPPYSSFDCSQTLAGVRLDGPVSFFHNGRLFVVARKHLSTGDKKRTALYELTGNLEGGPLSAKEWGELPSAGDTAYAGVVDLDADHTLVTWYSSDVAKDEAWLTGMLDAANIWTATFDFTKLQ
jgi:hypothetical protein